MNCYICDKNQVVDGGDTPICVECSQLHLDYAPVVGRTVINEEAYLRIAGGTDKEENLIIKESAEFDYIKFDATSKITENDRVDLSKIWENKEAINQAVVWWDGKEGKILQYIGKDIEQEIEEYGITELDSGIFADLSPPLGMSIWTGGVVYDGENESATYTGTFRRFSVCEMDRLQRGFAPWRLLQSKVNKVEEHYEKYCACVECNEKKNKVVYFENKEASDWLVSEISKQLETEDDK